MKLRRRTRIASWSRQRGGERPKKRSWPKVWLKERTRGSFARQNQLPKGRWKQRVGISSRKKVCQKLTKWFCLPTCPCPGGRRRPLHATSKGFGFAPQESERHYLSLLRLRT